MTENLLIILLLVMLIVIAVAVHRLRSLFAAAMLFGLFSLVAALAYVLLDAVDVALTEAAVGAGISTILMLSTLALTHQRTGVTRVGCQGVQRRHLAVIPEEGVNDKDIAQAADTVQCPAHPAANLAVLEHRGFQFKQ